MNRAAIPLQAALLLGTQRYQAVVVHSLTQAVDVLRVGRPVTLLSAPGAALAGGCGWWRALVDQARAEVPHVACIDILDCADAPGFAMAALRMGQLHLVLWPTCPAFPAVTAAASALGAAVLAARPEALDLGSRGAARKLREYLCP